MIRLSLAQTVLISMRAMASPGWECGKVSTDFRACRQKDAACQLPGHSAAAGWNLERPCLSAYDHHDCSHTCSR